MLTCCNNSMLLSANTQTPFVVISLTNFLHFHCFYVQVLPKIPPKTPQKTVILSVFNFMLQDLFNKKVEKKGRVSVGLH